MRLSEVGEPIEITFRTGETVKGWLYGELPEGFLISMDQKGSDVRLFAKDWSSRGPGKAAKADYSPPEDSAEKLDAVEEFIGPRMEVALRRLDFRPVQYAVIRERELSHEIHGAMRSLLDARLFDSDAPAFQLLQFTAARTDEVLGIHQDVMGELERAGVTDIVEETRERLPDIPARYLLPMADANSREDMERLSDDLGQWRERGWTATHHKDAMTRSFRARETLLFNLMRKPYQTDETADKAKERRKTRRDETPSLAGSGMRYLSASLRILAGTGFAAANLGVGLTAGLASTILTIGATAVPTYVGVITSVGT